MQGDADTNSPHDRYTNPEKQKANPEGLAFCLILVVVMGGVEPPTYGL